MQDVFTRRFDKPQHPDVGRYRTLLQTLSGLRHHFQGRRVLDYGAGYGVSMCALLELGAERVVGVEIDEQRVVEGRRILADYGERAVLLHTPGHDGPAVRGWSVRLRPVQRRSGAHPAAARWAHP